jgi:hypothetical protein
MLCPWLKQRKNCFSELETGNCEFFSEPGHKVWRAVRGAWRPTSIRPRHETGGISRNVSERKLKQRERTWNGICFRHGGKHAIKRAIPVR